MCYNIDRFNIYCFFLMLFSIIHYIESAYIGYKLPPPIDTCFLTRFIFILFVFNTSMLCNRKRNKRSKTTWTSSTRPGCVYRAISNRDPKHTMHRYRSHSVDTRPMDINSSRVHEVYRWRDLSRCMADKELLPISLQTRSLTKYSIFVMCGQC